VAARNTNANVLAKSVNHINFGLRFRDRGEYDRAAKANDMPRKPNPSGKPRYLPSLVSLYGLIMNQTRIKQRNVVTTSIIIRSVGYILVANIVIIWCILSLFCFLFFRLIV
jgi:hypothetical protein